MGQLSEKISAKYKMANGRKPGLYAVPELNKDVDFTTMSLAAADQLVAVTKDKYLIAITKEEKKGDDGEGKTSKK
jgi:hypothetical protein